MAIEKKALRHDFSCFKLRKKCFFFPIGACGVVNDSLALALFKVY